MWEQLAQEVLKLSKILTEASGEIENYIDEGKRLRTKIAELERLAAKNNIISDISEAFGQSDAKERSASSQKNCETDQKPCEDPKT